MYLIYLAKAGYKRRKKVILKRQLFHSTLYILYKAIIFDIQSHSNTLIYWICYVCLLEFGARGVCICVCVY
jgi:hypothetical protein